MYCIRHIRNSGIFRTLFIQLCSGILKHIQHYSNILRDTETLFRHIQAYYGIFRTLCVTLVYRRPCHTLSPRIFRADGIFRAGHIQNPETKYIQNPSIVRTVYSSIIQPFSGIFRTLCSPCICENLAYFEPWNIQNHSIIASRQILRTLSYLQKWENPV